MADKSKIEWTEATVNVVVGCTKKRPQGGCKNCYAERLFPRAYPGELFTNVRYIPERLDQLRRWKKGRLVFLNSMGDIFHKNVLSQQIHEIFDVVQATRQHIYQILTKRPDRAAKILKARAKRLDALSNVWIGVSAEDQDSFKEATNYLPYLGDAAIRFLSLEPLIGPISMGSQGVLADWVIVGAESGPNKRPMDENWVRIIRDDCDKYSIPFFYKQRFDGDAKISCPELDGRQHNDYPDHLHEYRSGGQRKLI